MLALAKVRIFDARHCAGVPCVDRRDNPESESRPGLAANRSAVAPAISRSVCISRTDAKLGRLPKG
jgi:hypothetical protein